MPRYISESYSLASRSLQRWLDRREDDWRELPDDHAFRDVEKLSRRVRLTKVFGKPFRHKGRHVHGIA